MRRIVVVATAVVALLGALSPPASAQAPAPKVTINGLIDAVTVGGKNFNDGNYARTDDSTWHARNRGVFTITGEVGKAKGVLALEIDAAWGQTGQKDGTTAGQSGSNASSNNGVGSTTNVAFTNGGFDSGVDTTGILEIKNLYVEFPAPWIPFPTVMRLGAQPTQVTMKPSVLFTTDYPGVWLSSTLAPWLKLNLTYAQLEERVTGMRVGGFPRGDDFVLAPSIDIEPMKGIKIRPLWVWYEIQGNSYALSRCRILCAGLPNNGGTVTVDQNRGLAAVPGASHLGNYRVGSVEDRHYFAVDAQTNFGPFYFDPTVIYMTSSVDVYRQANTTNAAGTETVVSGLQQATGSRLTQNIESWVVDLRGGWRAGPLLVEGIFMWSPGDDAQHDSFRTSKVYHAVSTDGAGWAGWADILTPGTVDYLTGAASGIGENTGFGRYGILRAGAKASYALTPAFTVRAGWNSYWTDTKVDTDAANSSVGATAVSNLTGLSAPSFGNQPCAGPGGNEHGNLTSNCSPVNNKRGDDKYIGTEVSVGLSYAFAPGLAFDMVYAHLFAGSALDSTQRLPDNSISKSKGQDADLAAARVRYQF